MNQIIELFYEVVEKRAEYLGMIPTDHQLSYILPITTKQVAVLRMRFNPDGTYRMTQKSIAEHFKVTRETIRKTTEKAITTLLEPDSQRHLESYLKE